MGPKRNQEVQKRNFQWTPTLRLAMADYVRANYESYKKALGSQKKIQFLRSMRDSLKLPCDDLQLKNGFTHFVQKYNDVETKLAASGFGVDPEKDATLSKGWIHRKCPYYEILNEVMGTRPNIRPPFIISTSAPTTTDEDDVVTVIDVVIEPNASADSPVNIPCDVEVDEAIDESMNINEQIENAETVETSSELGTREYVKNALSGIDFKTRKSSTIATPIAAFTKLMTEKTEESAKVEREKLQMAKEHFEISQGLEKEKLQLETLKFNSQRELDDKRLSLEEYIQKEKKQERDHFLQDKKEEREHELLKLKLQHEFELKKLEIEFKHKH